MCFNNSFDNYVLSLWKRKHYETDAKRNYHIRIRKRSWHCQSTRFIGAKILYRKIRRNFSGFSLSIAATLDASSKSPLDCLNKTSVKDFRSCIDERDQPFIKTINTKPYTQIQDISSWHIHKIILPSDGTIQTRKRTNQTSPRSTTTFVLNQSNEYDLYLFDRDNFLLFSNPGIIQRSTIKIPSKVSLLSIYIKVNTETIISKSYFG